MGTAPWGCSRCSGVQCKSFTTSQGWSTTYALISLTCDAEEEEKRKKNRKRKRNIWVHGLFIIIINHILETNKSTFRLNTATVRIYKLFSKWLTSRKFVRRRRQLREFPHFISREYASIPENARDFLRMCKKSPEVARPVLRVASIHTQYSNSHA